MLQENSAPLIKITRKEYMADSSRLHQPYYKQFLTYQMIAYVGNSIGLDRIKASTDEHFNDIELREWDKLSAILPMTFDLRKQAGEDASLGTQVCIAKAAAQVIRSGELEI